MNSDASNSKEFLQYLQTIVKNFINSRTIEEIIPRQLLKSNTNGINLDETYDFHSLQKCLTDPIYELLDRGGKRIRAALCFIIADTFNFPHHNIFPIAAFCELLHNGTLIIDDVEDDSQIRRNGQCLHKKYGVDVAVNAGNYLYFAPLQYLLNTCYSNEQKIRMTQYTIQQMTLAHIGQAQDIAWHNLHKFELELPNEQQYLQMTANKTGVLQRIAAKLTCIAMDLKDEITEKIVNYAEKLGIAFQIQDDILNLVGEEYIKTKGELGEDIHEGKISILIIHAMKNSQHHQRLREILTIKTTDQIIIQEAIQIIKDAGSIEYAKKIATEIVESAWNEIENNLENTHGKSNLQRLGEFVIGRKF